MFIKTVRINWKVDFFLFSLDLSTNLWTFVEGQYHLSHMFDDLLKTPTTVLSNHQHRFTTEDRHSTTSVEKEE